MADKKKVEDRVVKDTPEFQIVEFTAKKGTGQCKQYKTLEAAVDGHTDVKCLRDINRQIRTDAINDVNRPQSEAAIKRRAQEAVLAENPELQKAIDAKVAELMKSR